MKHVLTEEITDAKLVAENANLRDPTSQSTRWHKGMTWKKRNEGIPV